MQLSTYIFALYIGFLTLQPSIGVFHFVEPAQVEESCETSCCKSDCQSDQPIPINANNCNDCCPNGICNPLLNCYCCIGVTMKQSITEFLQVSVLHTGAYSFSGEILSPYIADCFNPPELV